MRLVAAAAAELLVCCPSEHSLLVVYPKGYDQMVNLLGYALYLRIT